MMGIQRKAFFGALILTTILLVSAAGTASAVFIRDGFNPDANDAVFSIVEQPDGSILAGGSFTIIGGATRNRIARLYTDGTLEADFNPNANGTVYAITRQPDGKILLGGNFTEIGGVPRNRLARLNADGSLDLAFDPAVSSASWVYSVVLQPDGRILVGGLFTSIGGVEKKFLARLHNNGTLDETFNPSLDGGGVYALARQTDGKILVGGAFTSVGSTSSAYLARLNADGSPDASFTGGDGRYGQIVGFALQGDGRIIISGDALARLKADGTLDATFNPGANGTVYALALQPDDRILVGGAFTAIGGVARNYLARLNADATVDAELDIATDVDVRTIALQANGRILLGGVFTMVGGVARNGIARLTTMEPVARKLQLPKTGQTACYDEVGAVIDCANTGQDGELQTGAAWPELRFMDNGDQTVTDFLTGLMWAKDAGSPTIGACYGGDTAWQRRLDYVKCLNESHHLGHDDWRLANVQELKSLIHIGQSSTARWLREQGVDNLKGVYESSTPNTFEADLGGGSVRTVDMDTGIINVGQVDCYTAYGRYMWLVRSAQSGPWGLAEIYLPRTGSAGCYLDTGSTCGAATKTCDGSGQDGDLQAGWAWPAPRFTDNGDQTLTDQLTGLIWTQDGAAPGPAACVPGTAKTWQGALNYMKCLNANVYLNHSDWRLPNVNELMSLVHFGQPSSAFWLNSQGFTNVQGASYLSSSTYIDPAAAWAVDLGLGHSDQSPKLSERAVWPVRGGQSGSVGTLAVSKTGNGTVTSNPAGIQCGDVCQSAFATGTPVTLTTVPAAGFAFAGWSGSCSGKAGAQEVLVYRTKDCTATFFLPGDVNGDLKVTVADAILALQVTAGTNPIGTLLNYGLHNDGRINLAEVVYILQETAGLRQ